MKNLENFGVQEMNASEIKETDGGCVIIGDTWICPGDYLAQAGDYIADTASSWWNAIGSGINSVLN